jgi:hypothetical protein
VAALDKNIPEFICAISQILWLFANYSWMIGELHDYYYTSLLSPSELWYEDHHTTTQNIMNAALIWLKLYWLIIKPVGLFIPSKESLLKYERKRILPVYSKPGETTNIHLLF